MAQNILSFLTNFKDICSTSLVSKNWGRRMGTMSDNSSYMLKLIETKAQAILCADQTLITNPLFISEAIINNLDIVKYYKEAIKYTNPSLKQNKEFILKVMEINGLALEFVDESFKNDKDIVLAAVRQNGLALKFASPELQKDEDVVLAAIQQNAFAIEFAPELQSNKMIALVTVRLDGRAAFFLADALQNDSEVMLEAWNQNKRAIRSTSLELRSDKNFMLNIASQDGYLALQYACGSLPYEKDFILTALKQNREAIEFVPKEFLNDPDVIAILETASLDAVPQNVKTRFMKMLEQWDITIRNVKHEYLPFDRSYCRNTWIRCIAKTSLPITGKNGEFIHANTVNLPGDIRCIATIYPLIKELFWSTCMLKTNVIIDLTNDRDIKRNSLELYYPNEIGQTIQYGSIEITCLESEKFTTEIAKYQYKVTNLESCQTVLIDRIHYLDWEDVCGTNARRLLDVIHAMKPYENQDKVPMIHCVGGMGRSGTLITAASLKKLIEQRIVNPENLETYMESIVFEGRLQRSLEFIQTDTQIETVWELANNCLTDPLKKN